MTPRLSRTAISTFIAALVLALAPGAFAASEQGDAGDLRATAQDLGSAPVTTIWGTFTDASDADVYRLCLANGSSFSASTVGATTLDTQMFLFDSDGFGVYANDDAGVAGSHGSRLPANHRFSPDEGGEYFLAISSFNRDPQSDQGEIFQDRFDRFSYPDGVLDANGFGSAMPLTGWAGRAPGVPGLYRITVTGSATCVPPDTTPPTIDLRSPVDGARVPQGASVVVDFSCADEGGSELASCQGTTPDGASLDTSTLGEKSVTVVARDGAGNETTATHTITVVDEAAPQVTLDSPSDGAVYTQGEEVLADYSCADEPNGSGLATCSGTVADGEAVDTDALGEHTFTVEASDNAGNTTSRSATYTVVDRAAPSISISTPANGASYALGAHVVADYSCADEANGSGLATCSGTVADGAPVNTASVGEKTFTVQATDAAGNSASKSVKYNVVDSAPPAITLTSPADGGVYSLGQRVLAAYSCQDQGGGSGVAVCQGTVPNGAAIDTSRPGAHSFEVRAADGRGNTATKTVTYAVGYDFRGFFWPVANPPKVNRWKAGVPVPIRFSLDGYKGRHPEAAGYPRSERCDGEGSPRTARSSNRRQVFQYDRRSDRYVMLWKTDRRWAGTCREFVLKLDDGSVHTARFLFVKKLSRDRDHDRDRDRDRDRGDDRDRDTTTTVAARAAAAAEPRPAGPR